MDKAQALHSTLQKSYVASIASHNSSVEEVSSKFRALESDRLSSLAEKTLTKMTKAVSNHAALLSDVIDKCQSHNSTVSTRLDQVTQLKVQRLLEIKQEAQARLSRAIDSHEALMASTSLRCQSHNAEVGTRFETLTAKRDAKMKVLQSSRTVKVLQAELNHACLISEVVQNCGVHTRSAMEKGGEATRLKGERTLTLMKEQYEKESNATANRDDVLMQIQAGCGGRARNAIVKGEEATKVRWSDR